ncbi:MAG: hypothetical protein M0Q92_01160 [Methanoregula sp.]|jgi:hypothetical protein|nr:hypothetical protein [Methanoregula sp.]
MATFILVHGGNMSTDTWNRLTNRNTYPPGSHLGARYWEGTVAYLESHGHTVFAPVADNNTHEMVFGSALAGDYVLYRNDVRVDDPRERYSELCLYTISAGKTVMFSPLTGKVTGTQTESDKNAFFNIGAGDTARVAWYVAESVGIDRIMVLAPSTMSVLPISPNDSVYSLSIDGRNMAWQGSDKLFGKGTIYVATETEGVEGTAADSTPVPTKSPLPAIIALAAIGFCCAPAIRRRKD